MIFFFSKVMKICMCCTRVGFHNSIGFDDIGGPNNHLDTSFLLQHGISLLLLLLLLLILTLILLIHALHLYIKIWYFFVDLMYSS